MIWLLCIFHMAFSVSMPDDHAIYISVMEISKSESDHSCQIKIKVFSDDLEDALLNHHREVFYEVEKRPQLLSAYFNAGVDIEINGETSIPLVYQYSEPLSDAVWLYFDVQTPQVWKDVTIRANYFTELFPTQSNILQVQYGDHKEFARLNKKTIRTKFSF